MTQDAVERSLFADGGEVGRAMSALDWSQTAVGLPGTWPSALRNAVRVLLTSRFSMWAAWGPELTMYYNDAYQQDTLRAKHPWALGRPAREVWAEIWHDIGPRIQSVLDTGIATWDEDLLLFLERSGYPEETYHTFSYSPLGGEDGGTQGMLCVVTENTQRVVGERRMAHLRDLAASVATARTEPDVLAAVADQLGQNRADLPFSTTYLFDPSGNARLGCAAGIALGAEAAPTQLLLDDAGVWPLARIRAGEQVLIDDLGDRFADLPTGAWRQPPTQAVAVPIASPAQGEASVAGFLVVGLNPHRRYDDTYRGYLELVANQIATGLLNARSYEAERRRAEALAELDRAKTDFFSNVSHEFRTPLTLIMGPIAELRASWASRADPRSLQELEVIERNALRLGKLVNTLLDFSRIQAGRIDARFEPVDLAEATAELASVFRSAVARAGLQLTVDCPPLPEPVHIDREMWEKVVLNLLSNALKFTFHGGITVRLRTVEGAADLTVADTGTGVSPQELPRLFERFHRVADARGRSGEGSGIGLAMVRELVGLHGGSIDVDSTVDVGTTFRIRLPLGTAHLPADRLVTPAREAGAVSQAVGPFVAEAMRWLPSATDDGAGAGLAVPVPVTGAVSRHAGDVLVADDNADMREYVQRLLAPHYAVRAVADGQEALDSALADPPDLVVSDVMMPRLDGMALLSALRADARTSRIPVLLLSARAGEEAAVEGLAAGADDYLVKPFSAQELLARVGAHLHLGRARREAEQRFTAMADLAPALIWVADEKGRRTFVNRGWSAFTGRTRDAELGDRWEEGLHPDDGDRYREVVGAAGRRGEGWEVEFRLRRSDGAFHWLIERAAPIGADGTVTGYVGSCTDINARYRESERQTLLADVGSELDRETAVDDQLSRLSRFTVTRRLADFCTARVAGPDGKLRYAAVAGPDAASEAVLAAMDPDSPLGRTVLATARSTLQPDLPAEWPSAASERHGAVPPERPLGMRSAVLVPLTVRGRVLAVLALGRQADAPPYNEDDLAVVEEVAARAALALDNAMLLADERAAAHRLTILQRATAELSAATTPAQVGAAAAGHIWQLTGPESRVAVYELDTSLRSLSALTISGASENGRQLWANLSLSAPVAVTDAVTRRGPVWTEDHAASGARADSLPPELADTVRAFSLGASVGLPLVVAGRVVGAIGIGFPGARRFEATERAMLLAMAEQCAQALDRARLYRAEQGIAGTLQRSLLPARLPSLDRLALAAHYLPGAEGTQAGGDWYDVVALDDSRVAIAVGDVVGQGPAAAAVMGQLRSALSAALLQGSSPAAALELLDRFASRLPGALASSAACLVIDRAAGTVCWARAGHPPPLLLTPQGARLLDAAGSGAVLGMPRRPPYTEGIVEVGPGTTLLLYTDGLIERRDEDLDSGLDRLRAVAAAHARSAPALLTRRLLDEMLADTGQPDDVAVIAARLLPDVLQERLPADPARLAGVRRSVTAWAEAGGVPEETLEDLQLALGEAAANSVEHAYPGSGHGGFEYRVALEPDGGIAVHVRDTGDWRPPPADRGHRGRGLELIAALATDVEVAHPGDDGRGPGSGTTVSFRMRPPDDGNARDGRPYRRRPLIEGLPTGGAELVAVDGPDGLRLEIVGEVDLATVASIGGELRARVDRLPAGVPLTLDFGRTTYLASAGVGLLLQVLGAAGARGTATAVVAPEGSAPARLLRLSGLGDLLTGRAAGPDDADDAPSTPLDPGEDRAVR